MAEGFGGVAESGIVEGRKRARVFGGGDVEGLEGSQLLRVDSGGGEEEKMKMKIKEKK